MKVINVEDEIKPFDNPYLKELLEQQRIILETHKVLVEAIARPMMVFHSGAEIIANVDAPFG